MSWKSTNTPPTLKDLVSRTILVDVEGETRSAYLHWNGWFYESGRNGGLLGRLPDGHRVVPFGGWEKFPIIKHWRGLPRKRKMANQDNRR